jgi:hypothetical protein
VGASGPQQHHQLFGHDPGAARDRGRIDVRDHGRLFVIDVGMSPAIDYSEGAVLLIDRVADEEVATSLDAAGARRAFIELTTDSGDSVIRSALTAVALRRRPRAFEPDDLAVFPALLPAEKIPEAAVLDEAAHYLIPAIRKRRLPIAQLCLARLFRLNRRSRPRQ